MNIYRYRAAVEIADAVPVLVYRQPRAVLPWRATAVLSSADGTQHVRITAPGFTRTHAETRARRDVLRHVLEGWWGA